jgi:hypothetical protein
MLSALKILSLYSGSAPYYITILNINIMTNTTEKTNANVKTETLGWEYKANEVHSFFENEKIYKDTVRDAFNRACDE